MKYRVIATLFVLAAVVGQAAAGGTSVAADDDDGPAFELGEVLVQFRASATAEDKAAALKGQKIATSESVSTAGDGELVLATLPPGLAVAAAAGGLAKHPAVRFAEPNYIATKVTGHPRWRGWTRSLEGVGGR